MIRACFVLSGLAIIPTAAWAGAARPSDTRVAIEGVRVFDGQKVLPSVTVIIEDGRIASVAPGSTKARNAARISGEGLTLLPGLVDAHVHLAGDRRALEEAAQFGATTVLEMWAAPDRMRKLRQLISAEPVAGEADFLTATLSGPDEAQGFVGARLAEGSQYIKIILERGSPGRPLPTLDSETLRAVVGAAHRQGRKVIVHATRAEDVRLAVDAGADGLAHAWPGGVDRALLERLAARRVFVIPTLTAVESKIDSAGSATILADPRLAPYLSERARENLESSRGAVLQADRQDLYDLVHRLKDAGITILAGTDAGNPGISHGVSLHRELELLVSAGLSAREALAAATAAPANTFGLSDRGRIVPDARADLLLVRGDPSQDIRATRAIVAVWKKGHRVPLAR